MTIDTSVFARIIKQEKQEDGTLLVTGIATDDTLDIDEQICDPSWLERAMPAWFKYGNIREQHSNIAAGVATKLEVDGTRHLVTARVVDPNSVNKVELGVLKGFSIGIRNPRISTDKAAPGGRIVDGEIVEVSLVDRPANPSCMLELAKSVGGVMQQTETLIEKEAVMERCSKCMKAFKADDLDAKMCKACKAAVEESTETSEESSVVKADMGACKMCGAECAADGMKSGMCDKCYNMKAAEESSQKIGEESSQTMGEESSREGGVAGVAGKAEETEGSDTESSLGEETSEESSSPVGKDKLAEETDAEATSHTLASIAEQLARIEAMLSESKSDKSSTEEIRKSVDAIDERVSKVEKSASRGPVRTVVKAVTAPDETATKAAQAADYRAKAAAVSDPALAKGYLLLAHEAEHSN